MKTWIRVCISTSCFSILINGTPRGNITSTCGLCQGDQLSALLFDIEAEGLTKMIFRAQQEGILRVLSGKLNGESIPSLQYADDNLLMVEGNIEMIKTLRIIVSWFSIISGLRLNAGKSKVIPILESTLLQQTINLWGCQTKALPTYYLRAP